MRRTFLLASLVLPLILAPSGRAQAAEPLPQQWHKGVNITAFGWNDLSGRSFDKYLRQVVTRTRASEVTFVVSWYQWFAGRERTDDLNAVDIHPAYGSKRKCRRWKGRDQTRCKTPSMRALRGAVRKARRMGLRVTIRPQVDVGKNPDRAQPRDLIDKGEGERGRWFDSYKRMLSQYARLARDTKADGLVIGTGLSAMTNDDADRDAWRAIAGEVRSGALMGGGGGYPGEVLYAAQWDAVVEDAQDPETHLSFWDAVDVIGIDAYFPLVGNVAKPSEEQLRVGWAFQAAGGLPMTPLEIVRRLHAEYGKQVRFTALGYASRTGTATFPEKGDGELKKSGGKLSQGVQRSGVRAAFDVWGEVAKEGWFEGIAWWEWPAAGDRGGRRDGGFSLRGKLGQRELCRRHSAGSGARC